jgi:hypothetical protein
MTPEKKSIWKLKSRPKLTRQVKILEVTDDSVRYRRVDDCKAWTLPLIDFLKLYDPVINRD